MLDPLLTMQPTFQLLDDVMRFGKPEWNGCWNRSISPMPHDGSHPTFGFTLYKCNCTHFHNHGA